MKNLEVTPETAVRWYKGDNLELKNIALKLYPELENKGLPKTWDEFVEFKGYFVDENSISRSTYVFAIPENKNTFATKKQAESSIALAQLSQLREIYRNGWVPDWEDKNIKYCVDFSFNKITSTNTMACNNFLSFQDAETRDLFLKNFIDLIEKARPLFS
jgi:hypothetical protein